MVRHGKSESLFEHEISSIRNDLDNLRHDLANLVRSAFGRSRAAGSRAQARLHDRAGDLQHAVGDLRERGERATASLRASVSERPLISLAVAFGLGVMLGAVLKRG